MPCHDRGLWSGSSGGDGRLDAERAHDPRHPLAATVDGMVEPQLGMDPRHTVGPPAAFVDGRDPLAQLRVTTRSLAQRTGRLGPEPARGDAEQTAHRGHRMVGHLSLDEPERGQRVRSVSSAKKAAASTRISRSSSSVPIITSSDPVGARLHPARAVNSTTPDPAQAVNGTAGYQYLSSILCSAPYVCCPVWNPTCP